MALVDVAEGAQHGRIGRLGGLDVVAERQRLHLAVQHVQRDGLERAAEVRRGLLLQHLVAGRQRLLGVARLERICQPQQQQRPTKTSEAVSGTAPGRCSRPCARRAP